ncbi:lipase maturation factor family protein [Natronorubrum sp. JWXQ-INN-674]|uniref:Lipase maturation factor family protein n=1 Tax=Natronorubrum halalkaliphilum TaxID=2691917 RepID=A0A6B0VSN7_9EURY|nr:lipase maturation factor family protein [Natronorubrum halalkaliphilum]MXV64548.1 lipase maturation factor family protein [Natronorubrum halalkaliphilum]
MFHGEEFWLVRFLFQRGLAALFLLAFLVAAFQFRPLAGEDGLLPLEWYADGASFRERPSLFYFVPSDRAIGIAAWTGVALSALALVGVPYWLPEPYPTPVSMVLWATMWLLYLSFVNAGQTFYGYGWESMLLETGFLAIFLGAGAVSPPVIIFLLLQWVLFRNMFGAGLIKIRGDDCWRDLTCMDYHYETQPIPNPVSWYAHHRSDRFHRLETFGNHVLELAIPFLYFAPQPASALAGLATIGFQGWLVVTGNFAWLNALTIVLAIATFSDGVLEAVLPVASPETVATPLYLEGAAILVAVIVVAMSIRPIENMLSESQTMNTAFDPLHLVNTYGAFGSVTRDRYEVVIEGTTDDVITDETEWEAYRFAGKPTALERRPPQIAPYHLRLDWQLWFAAMAPSPRRHPWFSRFLAKLLEGDEKTLGLVAEDPFADREDGPEHVRATRYRYRYTTPEERAETGDWWRRERVGSYVEPVSLEELRLREPAL